MKNNKEDQTISAEAHLGEYNNSMVMTTNIENRINFFLGAFILG